MNKKKVTIKNERLSKAAVQKEELDKAVNKITVKNEELNKTTVKK